MTSPRGRLDREESQNLSLGHSKIKMLNKRGYRDRDRKEIDSDIIGGKK